MDLDAVTYFDNKSGTNTMDDISVSNWRQYWESELPVIVKKSSARFQELLRVEIDNDAGVSGCGRMGFLNLSYLYLSTITSPPIRDLLNMDFTSCMSGMPMALKQLRIAYYKAIPCLPLFTGIREIGGCLSATDEGTLGRFYLGEAGCDGTSSIDALLTHAGTYVLDISAVSYSPGKREVVVLSRRHDFFTGLVHVGPEDRRELFFNLAGLARRQSLEDDSSAAISPKDMSMKVGVGNGCVSEKESQVEVADRAMKDGNVDDGDDACERNVDYEGLSEHSTPRTEEYVGSPESTGSIHTIVMEAEVSKF